MLLSPTPNGFMLEPVNLRFHTLLKLSFPYAITSSSIIPIEKREKFQEVLAGLKLERDTWEGKYHVLNDKRMKMEQQLRENRFWNSKL